MLHGEFDFFGLPVGSRVPVAFPGDESCEVEVIGCAPGVLRLRRNDGYVRIVYKCSKVGVPFEDMYALSEWVRD